MRGNAIQCVQEACETVQLVGSDLRQHLSRELPAKVLLRKARDVVLLTGDTGVGKEKAVEAMHEATRRMLGRNGELVEVSCANLQGGTFESELFGYKRGAFTGADRDFDGLLGRAHGGTLVLDEIQALAAADQARLLRLLGEREYRAVGDDKTQKTDALIILASNRDLREMVRKGSFRRDLLDRALAKITIPPLHERRRDIGELAQTFAVEAAGELGVEDHYGLTRRARSDIETAVIRAREVSVRRLREIVRNAVFMAAADELPEALESDVILPVLETELAFSQSDRDLQDIEELHREFDILVGKARLREIADEHNVSLRALNNFCRALHTLIDDMHDKPRSYRNVVERTSRLSKVALWLVSGAETQAEFRKFFGKLDAEMPTKSVAHQIYHEVFRSEGDV
ncbi:MAG: sigma 54-interacting transcriptional regulator [Myxococcota bacterium]